MGIRKHIITCFLPALFFSCSVEKYVPEEEEHHLLKAVFEQNMQGTKTSLNGLNVVWNKGDKISCATGISDDFWWWAQASLLDSSAGSIWGVFDIDGSPITQESIIMAVYPYQSLRYLNKAVYINLPSSQEYQEGSFGNGSNPALGIKKYGVLVFYNLCGLMKLQLRGNATITQIALTTKGEEALWGESSTRSEFGSDGPSMEMVEQVTDKVKTVTLLCSEGVQLSESSPTTFFFALPPGTLSKGFQATIWDKNGGAMQLNGAASAANTIVRSQITTMPIVTYEAGSSSPVVAESSLDIVHDSAVFTVPGLTGIKTPLLINWGDGQTGWYHYGLTHTYSEAGEHHVFMQTDGAPGIVLENLEGIIDLDFTRF